MSDDLHKPSVVDLDALLQPISEENPSGESLRYSGLYDEISESRRAEDILDQGDWQTELKVADYRRVIDLAVPALTTQSKDLQIAVWLSEALVKQHGFVGLRDGLTLVAGLQENFWETLYPEVDEGDQEGRANAIAWMDAQVSFVLRSVPFTGNAGYSFNDWEDSKRFDFPENTDTLSSEEAQKYSNLRAQAEEERRVTAEAWKSEIRSTRRSHIEEVNFLFEECLAAFKELNRVVEEKFERNQMPGLSTFQKALDDTHTQIKRILEEKRVEEPDETDAEIGEDDESGDGSADGVKIKGGAGGAIQGRKDALKRLGEIAAFLQKTEPHSPVSYLVQRAVKWGNMPLDNWLQDVIKDETILYQLRETLGLATDGSPTSDYAETGVEG